VGAEVIKVEEPSGDEARDYGPFPHNIPHSERSGLFLYLNANKKGITLNLQTKTGKELFLRLIEKADVLVENYPPPQAEGLGLRYEALKGINPRIIVASITPYGIGGPYKGWKGYAINTAAGGGMSLTIGEPHREPLNPPLSLSHYQSGVVAATAVMSALIAREEIGEGQQIEVSEMEVWACLHTGYNVTGYVYHGRKRIRSGHRTPAAYPYTILPCKDGYFSLIAIQGFQWKRFLELMGGGRVPDWYENDPKFKDRFEAGRKYADELDAKVCEWLSLYTKEELFKLCRERKIPFTPVRTIKEVAECPHLRERGYFVQAGHKEAGTLTYPGPPFRLYKTPASLEKTAPLLGEHNREIYCHLLGLKEEELSQLRRAGVI